VEWSAVVNVVAATGCDAVPNQPEQAKKQAAQSATQGMVACLFQHMVVRWEQNIGTLVLSLPDLTLPDWLYLYFACLSSVAARHKISSRVNFRVSSSARLTSIFHQRRPQAPSPRTASQPYLRTLVSVTVQPYASGTVGSTRHDKTNQLATKRACMIFCRCHAMPCVLIFGQFTFSSVRALPSSPSLHQLRYQIPPSSIPPSLTASSSSSPPLAKFNSPTALFPCLPISPLTLSSHQSLHEGRVQFKLRRTICLDLITSPTSIKSP